MSQRLSNQGHARHPPAKQGGQAGVGPKGARQVRGGESRAARMDGHGSGVKLPHIGVKQLEDDGGEHGAAAEEERASASPSGSVVCFEEVMTQEMMETSNAARLSLRHAQHLVLCVWGRGPGGLVRVRAFKCT